jgi:hypothetical protein
MHVTHSRPDTRHVLDASGRGFLERYSTSFAEIPVLHVAGTPEEMGRQYGALAGDRIRRNADALAGLFAAAGVPMPLVCRMLDNAWDRMRPHVPNRYLREMEAVAAGAREAGCAVSTEDLHRIAAATNFDLYKRDERIAEFLGEPVETPPAMSCTMFAVWGSRTADGKMWSLRNLDWISQTGMHENRLVTVYRPEGRNAFVSMEYAGVIGALAGMNERGISISEVGAFSAREELDGMPWTLMARQVLEESDSLEDAVEIVRGTKHTLGYNYLVADGDPSGFGTPGFNPRAAAFETNHEVCEVFAADDPQEHAACWVDPNGFEVYYGLPLHEAVMRADTAFGCRARALQATDNGPGEPANTGNPLEGRTYRECHRPMYDMIRAYETGSEYVYPVRGTKPIEAGAPVPIGAEQALTIAATVAHNVEKLEASDWNVMSVVFAPTDLDFWVAYETRCDDGSWKNAPDAGYLRFNLNELLNVKP